MKPPNEPRKEDCCDSGCNPCIFDVYQKQLERFNKYSYVSKVLKEENGISEIEYTPFVVVGIVQLSNSQRYLKFSKGNNEVKKKVWWKPGQHFLIKFTSNEYPTCTRAYTPIKSKEEKEDFDFFVIVKKYNSGLVSNYLYNLVKGAVTLWRGPYGHYKIEPNKYDRIIMIAQGTGIAPFISIIENIISNEDDMTKIVLYYCCKDLNEVLLRNELHDFNAYWNFSYKIFLSNVGDRSKLKYEEPIFFCKFNIEELSNLKPFTNNQFLLCGSNQFMDEYEKLVKLENYCDNIIIF